MDIFKCYECGLILTDNVKACEHMEKYHNIKVVDEEITKSLFCSMCKFTSSNMNELKKHIMKDHEIGEHEWWTENIKTEYYCQECEIEFSKREMFMNHMEKKHTVKIL